MRKPMIGIMPLYDSEKDSYWMLPGYMEGIIAAGGLPVMLPLTDMEEVLAPLAQQCDGFLFTGGQDIDPRFYGQEKLQVCGECCGMRDAMESILFSKALAMDKPVLGICRGIQFINAALGGTLYQDLPSQHPSDTEHHQKPPYDQPVHRVELIENMPLRRLLGKKRLDVNSYHHQAICRLSPRLCAMAVSEDGLTEAVYMPDKTYVWAVQWHPEFSYLKDGDSRKIFESFIRAAGNTCSFRPKKVIQGVRLKSRKLL